ncbi:hypothetical protein DACRYDRAFT_108402 [Dacryopinax primogenitus]|uniref:Polysaccharide lyase family 7 protein n=1 Tax=Dacryopinax primogenitus (strain DJM 731) TaxID=1858805 RepID=M5FTT4_DACPD|nr:uncharacterized protein DACRYDRAFT_108402 [Dacryopinax primogenitus]EJU01071.1 hypothetical protein DACRYDRAFT_108402 [Dacryopinax primogenitus]
MTLADGSSYKTGKVEGLTWQASGVLTHGCSNNPGIADCFGMILSSDPNTNLEPGNWSPRQRAELHFPPQADGSTYTYQWKHLLAPGTGSTSHFFHLMQVFSTKDDGPILALDAQQDTIRIDDHSRNCNPCGPTVALGAYEGRVTQHRMVITSGNNGRIDYDVTDGSSTLISYSVTGYMGSGTYIKFGVYRATEDISTDVTAYVGDFSSYQ